MTTERETVRVLRKYISEERLAPYVATANGDVGAAERLYRWNITVSGAFYEVLAATEVPLRNALHRQLTQWHGNRAGHWFDDPRRVLTPRSRQDIDAARRRITQLNRPQTPGRVVAELNFGFWRFLLAGTHEKTLWMPFLRHAFPNLRPQRRRTVYEAVERINRLRNRIAHHEPIHSRDLHHDHDVVLHLASWLDEVVADWVANLSRVGQILGRRPDTR